jgi:hypothetical protein
MKIDKAIFGVDNSYFLEFWPIQAKICKELLGIEPVLFFICDEESDFYYDGNGLVKKIKKVNDYITGNIIHTGLLACIVRMYGTKYFPDEVCLTCDLDMLMINKEYFINQIENLSDDSLVIYSSDAYDLNRPEAKKLFETEPFPFTQEMYNYPYNAAKGKVFNKILDTDCSFEDFVNRHANYKPRYRYMWMIDEFYFSDCVNHKNHGIEVHKFKRGYTSSWIADRRIERHNFPVELEFEGEKENQKKFGIYDEEKLKNGYYIDVNCCRPYSKFKDAIDHLVDLVISPKELKQVVIDKRTELCSIMDKYKSDKASKPDWVDFGGHNYTRLYSQLFESIRYKEITLFELGIGTNNVLIPYNMGDMGTPGASLRGWKEYFTRAKIYGADIDKNILFEEERIKTFYCDETSISDIKNLWLEIGEKMDVIIDDGLHEFKYNLFFLENSLDRLSSGGYYIIEDICESDLGSWEKEIPKLRNKYKNFSFELISLDWTHNDNNLVLIRNNNIFSLGLKHNTDKVVHHRFDKIYNKFLSGLREKKVKLFEIGCGSDYASFNMWGEYFHNGQIFSMDINEEKVTDNGIVFKGDQNNKDDLQKMINLIGECDIIIDDGSHVPKHQINTFNFLFEKMLKNGGIYIIEDIECNYWHPKNTIYGYEVGNHNVVDYFSTVPHKINSEFSGMRNNNLISSITYFKNCIILTKMDVEEIKEKDREYRFKEML